MISKLTPTEREELKNKIIELYEQEYSVRDICSDLDLTYGFVYNVLKSNVIMRSSGFRKSRGYPKESTR